MRVAHLPGALEQPSHEALLGVPPAVDELL
jgi:hypothetical protein